MLSNLARNHKVLLSGAAVFGSYLAYKAFNPAQNAAISVPNKLSNTGTIIKEHVVAAKDDLKKGVGEVGAVVRQHAEMAKRDVSTAGSEVGSVVKGEPVQQVTVRDTPPLATNQTADNVRTIDIANKREVVSANMGQSKDWSKPRDVSRREFLESSGNPIGYEPATFSESPSERMHSTKYSSNTQWSGDAGSGVQGDKTHYRARDITSVHADLSKRDFKQGAKEVGQALFGDRIPDHAAVRDTPDLTTETPRDRIRKEDLSTPAAGSSNPKLMDRLHAAKEIVKEHTSAASEDMKQAKEEIKARRADK